VAATTVGAYRRAGAAVYEDILATDRVRAALALAGTSLWSARAGQSSQLL
jgi:hypothetical protein